MPIVADEHADPELGIGAVKITPGHDFNDFEVGKRAGFKPAEMLNMLDAEGRVVQTPDGLIPAELVGLDRFEARKRVVAMLEEQGLLEKVEDRVIATPFGDRGGVVIEPWLTDQWYVDAEKLAVAPMQAVRDGRIEIVPKGLREDLLQLDGEHPAVVRQPPAVVGAPDSGLVRPRTATCSSPRPKTKRIGARRNAPRLWSADTRSRRRSTPGSPRRCGRSPRSAGRKNAHLTLRERGTPCEASAEGTPSVAPRSAGGA